MLWSAFECLASPLILFQQLQKGDLMLVKIKDTKDLNVAPCSLVLSTKADEAITS